MYWVEVRSPDGTLRRTLSTEDPIDALAWTRRGDGDCGEGLIRGRGLDLRPRDIVTIRTATGPQYQGWVVESHDGRATDLVETRLVGGSTRLKEVINTIPWMPGGDLQSMAAAALALPLPPRLTAGTGPVVGFEVGPREPRLESLAATLDAFCAMAPGFTVPAGATYKYGLTTFVPGTNVPPLTWGTRAHPIYAAQVFVERVGGYLSLWETSTTAPVIVEWDSAVSEEVVDRVLVVLFDRASQGATWRAFHRDSSLPSLPFWPTITVDTETAPVPVTHTHVVPGSSYVAWGRLDQAAGESLRKVGWTAPVTGANATNPGYATDGSPSTYSANSPAGPYLLSGQANVATRGVRVRYSSFVPATLALVLRRLEGTVTWSAAAELNLPSTEGAQVDAILVCPPSVKTTSPTAVQVIFRAGTEPADSVRVHDLVPLAPDLELLDRLAQSAVVLPAPTAAVLTLPGRLQYPVREVDVLLADGSRLKGLAESWEYSITREEGFSTRVRVGHALPPEQARAQALLSQRLAKSVTGALRLQP